MIDVPVLPCLACLACQCACYFENVEAHDLVSMQQHCVFQSFTTQQRDSKLRRHGWVGEQGRSPEFRGQSRPSQVKYRVSSANGPRRTNIESFRKFHGSFLVTEFHSLSPSTTSPNYDAEAVENVDSTLCRAFLDSEAK